mmetsp:Transcript_71362/g.165022  ORF Transcript_71362/g.165022 Transcript_71362/m.165022 type:complete len:105 (+) Transcript_71362:149-463(+)
MSLRSARGFSRWQRELADDLIAQRGAVAILCMVAAKGVELDAVSAATALNRIAKSRGGIEVTGNPAFIALTERVQEFDRRGLPNSLWAFATLMCRNAPLLHAIS